MAEPTILDKKFTTTVTLGSGVSVKPGNLIGWSGSAWVLADADTPSRYAQWIATQYGSDTQGPVEVAREVLLEDSDAPFTAGGALFLSGTAGDYTATRPATDGQLRQVVGQALTTTVAHLKIDPLKETRVPLHVMGATSAFAQLDSGNFGGPTLDAQNEVCLLNAVVPENAVSLVVAKLYLAAEASAGTPTFDMFVSSAVDGEQWDAVTQDDTIANSPLEGAAPDEMQITDITAGFDAANIIRPGAILGVRVLKDDAGTDVSFVLGGVLVFRTA